MKRHWVWIGLLLIVTLAAADDAGNRTASAQKERLAKVDMEKMKARALNTFWDKQTFAELPRATRHRVRALDPTVLVPADMTAADGTVIHKAGDRINPLDMRPFTQRLVIIDPLDPQQVALAKKQVADYGAKQNVVVIVSRVARGVGRTFPLIALFDPTA